MGKPRVIAETGAGQHGVASATAAALLDLECVVYMGEVDTRRQALNVARMRMLGATVVPVTTGSRTLKDAINEALRDWVANVDTTHYLLGTAAGPHPFPAIVRDFVRRHRHRGPRAVPGAARPAAGRGGRLRRRRLQRDRHLPRVRARTTGVRLYGFEAGGEGVETGRHAASHHRRRRPGVLHGARTYVLQDDDGQTVESHSISAGLDYPGVGPEHAWLHDTGRAVYQPVTDAEAMAAFQLLCRTEGIIPAIESAHALAGAARIAPRLRGGAGPHADHRGQPVRPRRQGRAHRRRVLRHPRRGGDARAWREPMSIGDVFAKARAEDRGVLIGCMPAGFPTVDGSIAAMTAMVEAGCRRHRGGAAVLRPGDGRPGDPAGQRHRARRRGPHPATRCGSSRRWPAPARRWC